MLFSRKKNIKKRISLPKSKSKINESTLKLLELELEMEVIDLGKTLKQNKKVLTKAIHDRKESLIELKKAIKKSGSDKTLYKSGSDKTLYKKSNSKKK